MGIYRNYEYTEYQKWDGKTFMKCPREEANYLMARRGIGYYATWTRFSYDPDIDETIEDVGVGFRPK